jgi:hypothetical protein
MTKIYTSLLLLSFLLIAGCSNTSGPTSGDVLMPLAVNNTWIYENFSYDSLGNRSPGFYDTTLLVSSHLVNGEMRYTNQYGVDWMNRNDSLMTYYSLGSGYYIFAKYPMKIGESMNLDKWVITTESNPDPIEEAQRVLTYLGGDTTITVPAGTFKCIKYRNDLIGIRTDSLYERDYHYYCLNVGLIYSVMTGLDLDTRKFYLNSHKELLKYTLN